MVRNDVTQAEVSRRLFLLRAGAGAATLTGASALLAACGDGGTSGPSAAGAGGKPPAKPTGTLTIAIPDEVANYDARFTITTPDWVVQQLVAEGLTGANPTGDKLLNKLAASFETSADGLEWIFHMRPGVKFHDGEPADSAAAKATFLYALETPATFYTVLLPPKFRKLDASDPTKLQVALTDPFPDLATNLELLYIMSLKVIAMGDKAKSAYPVGTGPYKFTSYKHGEGAVLTANEDYWGDGPYFEQIKLSVLPEPATQVAALRSGQIQVAPSLAPEFVTQLKGASGVKLETVDSWNFQALTTRVGNGVFGDVRVRQAAAYAVDRAAIAKSVLAGQATVVDSYLSPGVYGYKEPSKRYPYDPEQARALLKQAGNPAPRIKFMAPAKSGTDSQQVAAAIAAQLRDVGFVVDLQTLEDTLFLTQRSKRDMYLDELASTPTPLLLVLNAPTGASGWGPPEYLKLIKEMTATPDSPKRLALLGQIQDMLAEQAPVIPLYTTKVTWGLRDNIQGFQPPKTVLRPVYGQMYAT